MTKPPKFKRGEKLSAAKLNQLSAAVYERTPQPGTGTRLSCNPTGFSYSSVRRTETVELEGFRVYSVGAGDVSVVPSVVSGASASAKVPVINGVPLSDEPRPKLNISEGAGKWVALKIEIQPTVTKVNSDPDVYIIAEGGGIMQGDPEVTFYNSQAEMNDAGKLAVINLADGSVTQNGIAILPLARQNAAGAMDQLGYIGPIGIRMCSSGSFVAVSPARRYFPAQAL
jgi:hypothetical protein